jgi:protein SCO1/2
MSVVRPVARSRRLSWLVLALAVALPAVLLIHDTRHGTGHRAPSSPGEALGQHGVLPDFSLVERSGRLLRRADLAGTPWLADFVYTHCEGSCSLLSARMARLHHRVGDRVPLVSFSVDPARDTPQALRDYADRFGASTTGWLFVTGDVAELRNLIARGFHLAVVDPAGGPPELGGTIAHSEKIVLVDRDSHIRRYYDGGSDEWIEAAIADLKRLGVAMHSSS